MKLPSLSFFYALIVVISDKLLFQTNQYSEYAPALIQLPLVAGLIYLVLQLEQKRAETLKAREESFTATFTLMLTLIREMSLQAGKQNISFELVKSIEAYIKAEQSLKEKEK